MRGDAARGGEGGRAELRDDAAVERTGVEQPVRVAGADRADDLVDSIGASHATRMLDEGAFEGGIVPKLRAAALAAGYGITAHIGNTGVIA